MPTASSPALSRVASRGCVVARDEGGGSGGEWGWGVLQTSTSIGELTLGPFPCQLSPGGDVFSA